MIRGCMRGKGAGEMKLIEGSMNACGCSKILANKLSRSLQKPGRRVILEPDSDPKHKTAKIKQGEKKVKNRTWQVCRLAESNRALFGILKRNSRVTNPIQRKAAEKNGRTSFQKSVVSSVPRRYESVIRKEKADHAQW